VRSISDPGVIDQDVESAERRGGLVDRGGECFRDRAVGLDGKGSAPSGLDLLHDLAGAFRVVLIGQDEVGAFFGQA
jgi:hypothetical protein